MFDEDPLENARICVRAAQSDGADHGDFHLRSVLRRLRIGTDEKIGDLEEFGAALSLSLTRLARTVANPRIGIVGSTDTGLLANTLTSAWAAGGQDLVGRLSITLMDRSSIPLRICEAYAARIGIAVDLVEGDFLDLSQRGAFDLVVMHGVVPFFPADQRADYLSHIAGWLSGQGILISSTHLGTKPYPNTDDVRTRMAIENLTTLAEDMPEIDAAILAKLIGRLEGSRETWTTERTVFKDLDAAIEAYEAAGLMLSSGWVVRLGKRAAAQQFRRYKSRCIVICNKAAAP